MNGSCIVFQKEVGYGDMLNINKTLSESENAYALYVELYQLKYGNNGPSMGMSWFCENKNDPESCDCWVHSLKRWILL